MQKSVSLAALLSLLLIAPVAMTGETKASVNYIVEAATKPTEESENASFASNAMMMYDAIKLKSMGLTQKAFEYALKGYLKLQRKGLVAENAVLSICDFSQSSRRKRLYVIDMQEQRVLINTYVAHGRNSGGEYARSFSNSDESHKSSLGFYVTRTTYYGGHGLALKIDGLERGINDRANARNIVVHGSDYVGANFLRNNKFNGRSFGCPAVPSSQVGTVINTIKNGSCLFIYHPNKKYLTQSKILNS